jgi:hypothetical protein
MDEQPLPKEEGHRAACRRSQNVGRAQYSPRGKKAKQESGPPANCDLRAIDETQTVEYPASAGPVADGVVV